MGFSSLATYVILFAVGMSMDIGLLLVYKDFFVKSSEGFELRQEINSNKLQSNIEIINFTKGVESSPINITIDSQEDFELGITDNISTTEEIGWLRLSVDNLSGVWYSDIYSLNYSINYTEITIVGVDLGATTDVSVQIRSATKTTELTGEFIGPDDTSNTFYTLDGAGSIAIPISDIHDNNSVIQVKAVLNRTATGQEPRIDTIAIGYKISYVYELNIKNTGKIRLDKNLIDLFIDGERVSRDNIITSNIRTETDILNPGLWDSEEIVRINISNPIGTGNHIINAVNEHSVKDSFLINI
jgi:archaellum component FlaF (FlaF/FlaG flagellin family)